MLRLTQQEAYKLAEFVEYADTLKDDNRVNACNFMRWLNSETSISEIQLAISELSW